MPEREITWERSLPYKHAARLYFDKGWTCPIPVRGKGMPVKGYTGRSGSYVSLDDIDRWCAGPESGWNIAQRLPKFVAAPDIDGYAPKNGATEFAQLTERLGPLPSTWRSTSRIDDTVSGIRFFRVPDNAELNDLSIDIQVIKWSWRYAVVWPSMHPETGCMYRWFKPDGTLADHGDIPLPTDFPELPLSWLEQCKLGRVRFEDGSTRERRQTKDRTTSYTDPDIPFLEANGIPPDHPFPQHDTLRDVCWDLHNAGYTRAEIYRTWSTIVSQTALKKPDLPWTGRHFEGHYNSAVDNSDSPVTPEQRDWVAAVAGINGFEQAAHEAVQEAVQETVREDILPDQNIKNAEQPPEQLPEQPPGQKAPEEIFRSMLKEPRYAKRALDIGFDSWFRQQIRDDGKSNADSWINPVDLGALLGDEAEAPTQPDRLARSDGICIGYQGMVHWLWGRPQNGKTVVALLWAAQELREKRHVLWIDLEHQKKLHVEKLLTLFSSDRELIREFFHLIEPDEQFTEKAKTGIVSMVESLPVSLVVVDAFNDLIILQGGDANDVDPTGQLERQLIQPCIGKGASVLVIDHMKKDSESHGWPINSGHKKAVADVGWEIETEIPFTRDQPGFAAITSYKDRPGNHEESSIIGYLSVAFGVAVLQKSPSLGDLSARAEEAGVSIKEEQRLARRQCILVFIREHQGEYTVSTAAKLLAEEYHEQDAKDGFSYTQFHRDITEMIKSKDGEVRGIPETNENGRLMIWLRDTDNG